MSKVTLEKHHEFKTGFGNVFGMGTSTDGTLVITGRGETEDGMEYLMRIFSADEGKLLTEFKYVLRPPRGVCEPHLHQA